MKRRRPYWLGDEPRAKAQRLNSGTWVGLFECNVVRGQHECIAVARAATAKEARRRARLLLVVLKADDKKLAAQKIPLCKWHDEGARCTRQLRHRGPHLFEVPRG